MLNKTIERERSSFEGIIIMKCPQFLNSLVMLQFVIVSLANDEEIDKRRRF